MSAADSVTALRRELVQGYRHWEEVHGRYPAGGRGIQSDVHAASLMASSYAYTLAAVLGMAQHVLGLPEAELLASTARVLLEDGDHDDLNADVMPAGAS